MTVPLEAKDRSFDNTGWVFFGQQPGLKTEGLVAFSNQNLQYVQVPSGFGVGSSIFQEYLDLNGLSSDEPLWEKSDLPDSLHEINRQMVPHLMQGVPYAVRSSALDERGGTGIYRTSFMISHGDDERTIRNLRRAEQIVYESYFSEDAMVMRPLDGEKGMGLLIQPVIGEQIGDHYMPLLSGVVTQINGEPFIRLVVGLGTQAVDGEFAIVSPLNNLNLNDIAARLHSFQRADAINLASGSLQSIPLNQDVRELAIEQLPAIEAMVKEWNRQKRDHREYYWEFAIHNQVPYITQSALEEEVHPKIVDLEGPVGRVIAETTDTVNIGIKEGRGIVVITRLEQGLSALQTINKQIAGLVVVIPQRALSRLSGEMRLKISHYSRAAAVVELQYPQDTDSGFRPLITLDHTGGRGGSHFMEMTKRLDILFQGVDGRSFNLGTPTEEVYPGVDFYNCEYRVTNSSDGQGRFELLSEAEPREYPNELARTWKSDIYQLARTLEDMGMDGCDHVYDIQEILDIDFGYHLFDNTPLRFVEEVDPNSIQKYIDDISYTLSVLDYIPDYEDVLEIRRHGFDEKYPLEEYLKLVRDKLQEKLEEELN